MKHHQRIIFGMPAIITHRKPKGCGASSSLASPKTTMKWWPVARYEVIECRSACEALGTMQLETINESENGAAAGRCSHQAKLR